MLVCKVLTTEEELEQVVDLVRRVYVRTGYIDPQKEVDLVAHTYRNRDDAVTIIVGINDFSRIVGTVSVVTDSKGPLPMASVYDAELSTYAHTGVLAEVRRFAVDQAIVAAYNEDHPDAVVPEIKLSLYLLGLAVRYAQTKSCPAVYFMIKREHAPFYESVGAVPIGPERPCPAIENKPVVAYKLQIDDLENGQDSLVTELLQDLPGRDLFST